MVHPVPNPMDTVPLRFKKKAVPSAPAVGDGNGKDVTVAGGQGRGEAADAGRANTAKVKLAVGRPGLGRDKPP